MGTANGQVTGTIPNADLLEHWRGGTARVWDFVPTLSTLTLRIESRKIRGNLHIVCSGTRSYSGPFRWENSEFEIETRIVDGDRIHVLRDRGGGFELHCEVIGVIENVAPVYDISAKAMTIS